MGGAFGGTSCATPMSAGVVALLYSFHPGQTAQWYRDRLIDTADDLDIPGYRLHQLKGSSKGMWSITVNANWRITYEFIDGNVYIVNYEDYH